jgi:hypothetical protein
MLVAPSRAWPRISERPSRHWLARPLFALFVYGCAASLMTSGRVTLRLTAMLHGFYPPLLQMAALAVVCRGALPFRRAVDLFFAGHAPMSLAFLAYAAAWGFAPTGKVYEWSGIWLGVAAAALGWSAYVDYWFFRSIAKHGPVGAIGSVVTHRAMWGIPAIAIFVGPAGWQEALKWAGL